MDLSRICTNCFKFKNDNAVCPYCGQTGAPSPKEAYHLQPGTVLTGRYLIGKTLGSGGFGVVYMTLDLKLGRVVALKEFFPVSLVCRTPGELNVSIYSGDKEAEYRKGLDRFLEEARNMADFAREPNIVNVFDFFQANRTAYIVMEYLNGVSFEQYLRANSGRISVEETLEIIKPVLMGLKVLHERSIVHRDINPKNIFITADNKVKLIDFGTAKFCDENERTRTNIVSDGYAPPEQYKTRSVEGAYTDIYAVGATMYRAITGNVPTPVLERAMEADKMPTPKAVVPDVPEIIDIAIMKAMAIKPKLRFQTVDEMMSALASPTPKINYPEIEEKKRVLRRNITVISALLAVVAILVGVVIATQKKDELLDAIKMDINDTETIYAYIPYEDDTEKENLEVVYDNLSEDFYTYSKTHFGKEITIEPVFVQEDEYEEEISSHIDAGNQVCIFRSDLADGEKADLELLVNELDEDMCFVDEYKEFYGPTYDTIPLSFSVYMQYSNRLDKVGMGDVDSWSAFENADSAFDRLRISEYAIPGMYSALKSAGVSKDSAKKIFAKATNNGEVVERGAALSEFIEYQGLCYVGTTEELAAIRSSDINMTYKSFNLFGNEDEWYGTFTQEWSVSAKIDDSKTAASLLFLRYCLSEQAQKILYVDHSTSKVNLSLNKNVLGLQKDFISDLQILPESEKINLLPNDSVEKVFARKFNEQADDVGLFIDNNY